MTNGKLHLYCGDGKGKTTAAMGLSLRAAGRGLNVVIAQFLKDENTGERAPLNSLPNVTLLPLPEQMKFVFQMTDDEKMKCARDMDALLDSAFAKAENADLLILDELCAALSLHMLDEDKTLGLIRSRPLTLEVVVTGRNPPAALLELADYITEMKCVRHPYEKGEAARKGIEF